MFGAGATGSLFAARLSGAGHDVLAIGRAAHVQAIARDGLVVEGVRPGVFHLAAAEALDGTFPPDVVLLAVKAFDLAQAARATAGATRAPVPTLLPQNGLGISAIAEEGLRAGGWVHPVLLRAIHSVPATWLGPGRVRQAGEGEFVLPETVVPAAAPWIGLVEAMGFPVRRAPDFEREVWRKLLVNAAINPVTADHGIVNGQLRQDPWRGQALALLGEARTVAAAEGHPVDAATAEADLWRVVGATAENRSSMLQDLDHGRPTEIEAISGALLRAGARHGLSLPATQRAWDRIVAQAARHRAPKPS